MKILLLHGWGAQAPGKIQLLAKSLQSKGHEVFAPHMPGFGGQEPPADPWTVNEYVQWCMDKLTQKNWKKFIVCGYSFGGRVALKLAVQHPKQVEKLVLIASAGIKRPLSLKARLVHVIGSTGKLAFSIPPFSFFKQPIHKVWRHLLRRKDYYQASGTMQKTFLNVIAEDLKELVHHISVPTLILWGKRDQFVPVSDAYFLQEQISNSSVHVFSKADHFLPYAYPDELSDEIDSFVRRD